MLNKAPEHEALLSALQARFEKSKHRHIGIAWADVPCDRVLEYHNGAQSDHAASGFRGSFQV